MKTKSAARHRPVVAFLAAVTAAIPAAAQERVPEPPSHQEEVAKPAHAPTAPVKLSLHGISNGLEVRIVSKEESARANGMVVASCHQDCELKLPTGSYTLLASQGTKQAVQDIELTAPVSLTVSEPSATLRGVGTGLGFTGIVVASLGAFVAGAALADPNGPTRDTQALAQVLLVGAAGVGIGAGLIVGGFSLASANAAPSMEMDPAPKASPPRRTTGMGISIAGAF